MRFLPIVLLAACAATPAELVRSDAGLLIGARARVLAWKGIPYAAPPTGPRRWRPPEPAPAWRGVRSAREFGPPCVQPGNPDDPRSAPIGSEDCLTLNVWAPAAAAPASGRPVMVFIHGGWFTWGSSSKVLRGVRIYDGSELAARAGVVVVTLNYRLGALGFVGHPALAAESPHGASGDYGILDQIAALRWVQRNIAAFGGDPRRVLVFGQSAGAISVAALYASPLARGLFARAILHSGAPAAHPPGQSEAAGQALAAALGCDRAPDALACLRARDAAAIVRALPESLDGGYAFGPNVDGWVLPDQPLALIARGAGSRVPLLVGVTADEFTTMIRRYVDGPITTVLALRDFLVGRVGEARAEALLAIYPPDRYPAPMAALVDLLGDVSFVCPSRRLARAASRHAPVRRFVFTHRDAEGPAARLGAAHGFDLPYLFRGFVGAAPNEGERALSDAMIAAWARFAAEGDPSGPGLAWPPYDPARDDYLVLDVPPARAEAFHGERCDRLELNAREARASAPPTSP